MEPDPSLMLHEDPTRRSLWWAVGYVLRLRTNLVLILASALGYAFFEGLRSFALVFTTAHYGIPPTAATDPHSAAGLPGPHERVSTSRPE